MRQKIMKIFCAVAILMTVFLNVQPPNFNAMAKEGDVGYAEPPFKKQLDRNAIIFYNALQSLYKDGKMKTGVGSYDLSKSFDYETLNKYANGDNTLAKAFQTARDAFVMDTPEIFYVDFSKVTLRLGMKDKQYVLYVNNGSNENYYASPFTSQKEVENAIAEVDAKKKELVSEIGATTLENPASIVSYIHNKLIETAEYTYPTEETRYVSTVYGTLVKGVANCDGYSRTFKWILDDYDIDNVLVAGVGKNARYEENDKESIKNTMNEYHQWNYVKLDDKWYGVDVTWDDPVKTEKSGNDNIRTTYLLRGSDMLNENHFPLGVFSEGSQEFKYPKLDTLDYGVLEKDENIDLGDVSTDLKVYVSKVEYPDQFDDVGDISKGTRYIVNYKNMTYEQLAEQGLYVAVRFGMSNTDFAPWELLDAFANNSDMDPKNLFDATVFTKTTMQFCLTKVELPKGDIHYGEIDLAKEGNHFVLTETIDAPYYQNYTPPPFIRTASPALTGTILPEKTHYEVEYYEELEVIDKNKDVSIKINNSVSHIDAKVENIKLRNSTYKSPVGKDVVSTIIEFDFTPDSSFQGYANVYNLVIENMQGVKSKKKANDIPIITTYTPEMPCPIYAAAGGPNSAFVMSNPKLVVDENMAENMFQDKNGNDLKYGNLNIALVATRTTGTEKENLDDLLGDKMASAKASSTFELNLGCGSLAAALKPGYHVSVGVPYPEGFHPEDYKDVEFRAYHFKEVNGKLVPEEIVCQITPQGLMIIANSFSPFTIVAYEKEQAPVSELKSKSVNVTTENKGGTITTNNGGIGTYAVEENQSRTFTVTPDEGYIIDKIILNNVEVKLNDKTSYSTTFDYDTMQDNNDIKVFFVAKRVIEEETKEIEVITPVTMPDEIKDNQQIYLNKSLTATMIEGVDIKLSGTILQNPEMALIMDPLSNKAISYFESINNSSQIVASGSPKLTIPEGFKSKEFEYEILVGDIPNDLTLLTYNDKNSKNTTKSVKMPVNNGVVKFTVSNLEQFVLINEKSTVGNKAYLNIAYEVASKLNPNDYTSASWNEFEKELKVVEELLTKEATQKEVSEARNTLLEVQSKLIERVNIDMLTTLIKDARKEYESGKYITTSMSALEIALKSADSVVTNADATEESVSNAYQELEMALKKLVLLGDKTLLNDLIKEIELIDLNQYTTASVTALKDVLSKANDLLTKEATQKELDEAKETLSKAQANLVKRANKEMLNKLLENAQIEKTSGKYTKSSIKALDMVVTIAKIVNENTDATEEVVTKVCKALEIAIQELVELGDKAALTQLVKETKILDLSKYTDASIKVLKETITNAQTILDDEEATVTQVEEIVKMIKEAIAKLEIKATSGNGPNDQETSGGTSDSDKDIPNNNNGGNLSNGDVKTGDSSNIMLWTSLFIGSACLLFIALRKSLKNR